MKKNVASLAQEIGRIGLFFISSIAAGSNHGEHLQVASLVDGELEFEWTGMPDRYYFIEKSLTLGEESWDLYPLAAFGDGGILSAFVPIEAGEASAFFRLIHTDDSESDLVATDYIGTGLSAGVLMQLGYNPFVWTDLSENQIHDAWEQHYFAEVGIDPAGNDDSDYTTNLEEFQLGLDPTEDERPKAHSYTYDLLGRLTGASNDVTTISYTLDEEGNILTRN